MSDNRMCKNCIWFEQCHEDEVCSDFEPLSLEEQEFMSVAEYEADLIIRHNYYQVQVSEQDE